MNPVRRQALRGLGGLLVAASPGLKFSGAQAATTLPASVVARWPAQGQVAYRVLLGAGGVVVGRTVHTWRHDQAAFELGSVSESQGLAALFVGGQARQQSQGRIDATGLLPTRFFSTRRKREDAADFDWTTGTVRMRDETLSALPGTQDLLSMYYQLALMRGSGEALTMPIATGRKLASYAFESIGYDDLAVAGSVRKAERLRVRQDGQQFEFWVQSLRDHADASPMPLKIRVTERNGQVFEQVPDDGPHPA